MGVVSYIAHSGSAKPGDRSAWNTVVALCLPESASDELSAWRDSAIRTVYPNVDPENYEIRATRVLAQRRYEHTAQRRQLVAQVTDLIGRLPVIVFAVHARRPAATPAWPRRHVDPRYRLLVQRVELHMRRDHSREYANLVFDQTDVGNDADRSRAIRRFRHTNDEGRSWGHVVDVPFFASPSAAPGVQLADFVAGGLRLYQVLRQEAVGWTSEWESAVRRLAELAATKSQNFKSGSATHAGLYTMPDGYYAAPPPPQAF